MERFQRLTSALAKSLGYSAEQLLAAFAPAVEADFEAVIRFRHRNLGIPEQWDEAGYFRWRYSFSESGARGNRNNKLWLVKLDGAILAMVGTQHVPLAAGSTVIDAIHTMDLLVDASVGGSGLGAWVQFALNQKFAAMLIIGANENSASIVRRIFHRMPNRELWKVMLDTEPFLRRNIGVRLMVRPISRLLNTLLGRIIDRKVSRHIDVSLRVVRLETFPPEVERLSASQRHSFYFRYRDADFLNWKFVDNPNVRYQRLGCYRGDELVGYVVYRLEVAEGQTFSVAQIEDFFWYQEDNVASPLPEAILAAAVTQLRRDGAGLIEVSTYGIRARDAMRALGFIRRDEILLFSLSCNVPALESSFYEADHWFLTEADAHGSAC